MKSSRNLLRLTAKLGQQVKPQFAASLTKGSNARAFSVAQEPITPSSYSDVTIPDGSFGSYILEKFEQFSSRVALINGETQETWTYAQTRDKSIGFSNSLAKLDVSKGDTVAILSPNCPEYVASIVGSAIIGAPVSPVNSTYNPEEISRQLVNCEAQVVICHSALYPQLKQACKGNKNIRQIIIIGKDVGEGIPINKLFSENGQNLSQNTLINSEDVLFLPYSSGTTGLPKGVMQSHRNVIANLQQMAHPEITLVKKDRDETFIGLMPFFHSYGLTSGILAGLNLGTRTVTVSKFDGPQYIGYLMKYKPTFIHTVPTLLTFLVGHPAVKPEMLSNTHTVMSGAAPVGKHLVNLCYAKFGNVRYQEGYGMTEASPVTHMTPLDRKYVNDSSGTTLPNTYSKLIHTETRETVSGNDVSGELCVKGPQVMKGYFKNAEETKDTIIGDGWLRTGDLAKIDKDGNIFIIDRLKELIKVKGLQVAPAELEGILRAHPAVAEVAVVGVPHDRSGEVPRAYIVAKAGVKMDVADVINFHDAKVAPHKKLDGGIQMLAELPKSATGKVLRRMLNGISAPI